MFGLIGKMRAATGRRADLIAILSEGTDAMPGCLSYVIAEDPADADVIWVTEVWDSEGAHRASLDIPAVRSAIIKGKPLIAAFEMHQTTRPVSGI
jgi:quinol monooxygenase YgiN